MSQATSEKFVTLRIIDVNDREVLHWVNDAADADGWATAREIVDTVGRAAWADPETAHRMVGTRLTWLKRYGAVDREVAVDERGHKRYRRNGKPVYTQRWRLTVIGLQWMLGELEASTLADRMDDAYRDESEEVQALLRRSWRYTVGK